jgi:rhamnosyltransferase
MRKVTVFIPTKNAGSGFEETLRMIFNQRFENFEVVVVDSGSNDETLDIAKKFPTRVYEIPSLEFGHGKTRNLALKYSNSEFIVFLTQDAVPLNDKWLSGLLKGFESEEVAGVFSKQVVRCGARLNEKFFYEYYFGDSRVMRPCKGYSLFPENIFFSNVSSALRRSVFEKYKFREDLIMSEDQQWAKDVIENGFKTVYEPESVVEHSHNYGLVQTFKRYFDSAFSLNQIVGGNFRNFSKVGAVYMGKEFRYVLGENPFFVLRLVLNNFAKVFGTTCGLHEGRIPLFVKKGMSMHQGFWR